MKRWAQKFEPAWKERNQRISMHYTRLCSFRQFIISVWIQEHPNNTIIIIDCYGWMKHTMPQKVQHENCAFSFKASKKLLEVLVKSCSWRACLFSGTTPGVTLTMSQSLKRHSFSTSGRGRAWGWLHLKALPAPLLQGLKSVQQMHLT